MTRYAPKALAAQFRAAPSLYLLTVLGVALGVASVLCIQIINVNAIGAFQAGLQAVTGEADLSVVGRTPTLPERLYPEVLAETGVAAAWPLYRVDVAVGGREGFFLEVAGVDLFAPRRIPWRGEPGDLATALEPGWVAVSPALASRRGWRVGETVEVTSGSRRVRLVVGALVDFQRLAPQASARLAVMDIAQAQTLLGRPGELHQIDLQAAEGTDLAALAARLEARLGPGVQVRTPAQREAEAAGLLGAFRLNLTALSLVSLFVGLFLVHEATQASLVRRRLEFGLLRSLGATRGQLVALILGEVAGLGLLGVALGLPLGYWAAAANLDVVSATLTNLYLLDEIETLRVPGWMVGLGIAIGLGGAGAGALLPALDVSRTDTRALLSVSTLHERAGSVAGPLFGMGALLLGGTTLWFVAGGRGWRPSGFVLAVALLLALPLSVPALVRWGCGRVPVRRLGLGSSVRSLGARLHTTSFAVASLAIAVSMLVGITVMIGSFRRTLEVWVGATVRADVYVTTESWAGAGGEATLDEALVAGLTTHPGVRMADRLRKLFVEVGGRRVAVAGVDMGLPDRGARFPLTAGAAPDALRRVREEGAVLISEPLSRKGGLGVGDALVLAGPRGELRLPVAGVYYDYSSERGAIAMDLGAMARHFGPGAVHSVALYLDAGHEPEAVADELRRRFAAAPLVVRENRRLRQEIFAIFDQTFAVTRILQAMSLVIAAAGITLTLLVLARERASELALYRCLGASRRQVFAVVVGQGAGLGGFGLGLGLLGGVALAGILIFVINPAYFGWTIQAHWPWGAVLQELATIAGAALLASLYPALRASQTLATELSREDA